MTENPATRACVLGIEAYERIISLDGASKPFEGHVVRRGIELVVSGPRGMAQGLSALWLLAARATGGGPPPNLRFFTPFAPQTPEDLNREVADALSAIEKGRKP
jgi:uncharacterized protein YbjT (DUF2867 family)